MGKRIVGRIPRGRKSRVSEASSAHIDIHTNKGIAFNAPKMKPGNPTGKGGGKRGKVAQWSRASRRRMREALLEKRPKDREEVAVTLTIPGAPLKPTEAKHLFKAYSLRLAKSDICAIWRIELQPRGQLHWHLLAGIRDEADAIAIRQAWHTELDKLGWVAVWHDDEKHRNIHKALEEGKDYVISSEHCEIGETWPGYMETQPDLFEQHEGQRWAINFRCRSMMPGAHEKACRIDRYDGRPNWLRYMQDHATKHKQEQIPEDIGRHWGIIGRKHYEEVMPETSKLLTDHQYFKILRWMQRLATPRVLDDRAPFGRRAGYTIRRGRFGRTVWFSNASTVQRMIDLALSLDEQ